MIITIDGPAGAGKSSVARELAKSLGFRFLDTGAMYRAVALAALRKEIAWDDSLALTQLAKSIKIELHDHQVFLDQENVTDEIRSADVTAAVKFPADNAGVREHLVKVQRQFAQDQNLVTEGRDQGSVVFPNANFKFYLSASAEERAQRRYKQQKGNDNLPYDVILAAQNERDAQDAAREVGPLMKPEDAIEVITDSLSFTQVVEKIKNIVDSKKRN